MTKSILKGTAFALLTAVGLAGCSEPLPVAELPLAEAVRPVGRKTKPAEYRPTEYSSAELNSSSPAPIETLEHSPNREWSTESNSPHVDMIMRSVEAYQYKVGILTHNLANVETTGYKRILVTMEAVVQPGEFVDRAIFDQEHDRNFPQGGGCRVSNVKRDFSQGGFKLTNRQLDLAIEGHGFFQLTGRDGTILYTRNGEFSINANGELTVGGLVLEPAVNIPQDTTDISITPEGTILVKQAGNASQTTVGDIQLARFVGEDGLVQHSDTLFEETEASGVPTVGSPGESSLGFVRQSMLESANVEPLQEQREIEASLQMIRRLKRLLPSHMADIE